MSGRVFLASLGCGPGLRGGKHCPNLHLKNSDSVFDLFDRAQKFVFPDFSGHFHFPMDVRGEQAEGGEW